MNIAIIGVGGTGSFAAQFLSKTGHRLTLIDGDVVEESNLGRQNLFTEKDLWKLKASQAEKILADKNAISVAAHLTTENSRELLKNADFILDCTDNWLSRMTINQYSLEKGLKWVYSGAIGSEAMVSTITGRPCFACFAQERPTESCSQANTTAQATSTAAAFATQEILNLIDGKPKLAGKLLYVDAKNMGFAIKQLKPKADCAACVQGKKIEKKSSTMCGGKDFLFFNEKPNGTMGKKVGDVSVLNYKKGELVLFRDGRTLVKNLPYEKAVEANEFVQRKLSE